MKFSGRKALWSILAVAGLGFCTLSVGAGYNHLRSAAFSQTGPENRKDLTRDEGYRIEVAIQTPAGMRIGYSVVHVYGWNKQTLQGGLSTGIFKGEAVAIDLDDGRTVFMTYASRKSGDYGIKIPWTGYAKISHTTDGKKVRDIPADSWPLFGFFKDPNVPSSIVEVIPGEEEDSLGSNFKITYVKVIDTDSDPTEKILDRLPWVSHIRTQLDGDRYNNGNTIADIANSRSFRQGFDGRR